MTKEQLETKYERYRRTRQALRNTTNRTPRIEAQIADLTTEMKALDARIEALGG